MDARAEAYRIAGNVLTSNPAEASRSVQRWTFTLEGNVLTLEDSRSEFDFTLANGAGVSATEKAPGSTIRTGPEGSSLAETSSLQLFLSVP